MARIAMAVALTLALVSPGAAQNFAPQPPPPPRPGGPAATICSTDWGWCPIQTVVLPGGGCYCFVPPSTWLAVRAGSDDWCRSPYQSVVPTASSAWRWRGRSDRAVRNGGRRRHGSTVG